MDLAHRFEVQSEWPALTTAERFVKRSARLCRNVQHQADVRVVRYQQAGHVGVTRWVQYTWRHTVHVFNEAISDFRAIDTPPGP